MQKPALFMLIAALFINLCTITAQIQTGVFRTPAGNTDYHQFTRNDSTAAAVFINQEAPTGPILRLQSGIGTATVNARFSFESNGYLGIGTAKPPEKLSLYSADTSQVFIQYGNARNSAANNKSGFVVGIDNNGIARIWQRWGIPISFGTNNIEWMRINADGNIDMFGTIRSASEDYQINTNGIFQSKGYRTKAGNLNYHQLSANTSYASAYINQESTAGPILRLSSGTVGPNPNLNVKFTFENNGNFGIGTTLPSEKLTLHANDTVPIFTQYTNSWLSQGFVVGLAYNGTAMVMHRQGPLSFGTSNKERMRINADGSIEFYGTIVSASGGYQIDTTGFFQAKLYRTKAGNINYHQFTSKNVSDAAVYINQEATAGPILRLSSGTASVNQNVKFTFENNGNLGMGTTTVPDKLTLYTADTLSVATQYANTKTYSGVNRAFAVGIMNNGTGMVWHRENLPISFGTYNKERMRINADGTFDYSGSIRSITGGFQIDTTGIFQAKGYRTKAGNVNYHQLTANNTLDAAVYINQESTTGPILRLSSGIATANKNIKFTFENSGNLGIGTTTVPDKLTLYTADTLAVVTQYGNTKTGSGVNRAFAVGIMNDGTGMVWHRQAIPVSFGTSNKERMRINSDGTFDYSGSIRSITGGFQIDTTGIFQSKGYRTKAGNLNWHQFTANNASGAVFINQEAASGPILRLSSGTANANQNVKFSFENNGNLGIGTTSPAEKLSLYAAGNTKVVTQYGNWTGTGYTVGMDENGNGTIWHTAGKVITFGTSNVERMRIASNGNIGIGTVSPDYKLDVVGGIRAYSVQISTAKTADFVFDENYPLRPLSEVESFVVANKHLPEVAPAAEMKEKGIDMADMQIKLLQKVEELTLYAIQQQKEIEKQRKEIEELKVRVNGKR